MTKDRKHWTVRKVTFEEGEELDLDFWAGKSIKERVTEATQWIAKVWAFHKEMHGEYVSMPDGKHSKQLTDNDDF